MHAAIADFVNYAGLAGVAPSNEQGKIAMYLEASGTKVTIEPDGQNENVIVAIFYPSPWKILEVGVEALRVVHYKKSIGGRAIAAGTVSDRLVLSTRLIRSQQEPQDIERAILDLCTLAEQCVQQADLANGQF